MLPTQTQEFFLACGKQQVKLQSSFTAQDFLYRTIRLYLCIVQFAGSRNKGSPFFFLCPFAQLCRSYIYPTWAPARLGLQEEINHLQQLLNVPFSLDIINLVAWAMQTTRNDFIFKHIIRSLYTLHEKIQRRNSVDHIQRRGKITVAQSFQMTLSCIMIVCCCCCILSFCFLAQLFVQLLLFFFLSVQ